MIQYLTILDAVEDDLQEKMPAGTRLETDSSIVLLVGPNGSGKTATTRLLYNSLQNEAGYRNTGMSHVLTFIGEDTLNLDEPTKVGEGYYVGGELSSIMSQLNKAGYDFDTERDVLSIKVEADTKGLPYVFREGDYVSVVSEGTLFKLRLARDSLNDGSPKNIFGNIQATYDTDSICHIGIAAKSAPASDEGLELEKQGDFHEHHYARFEESWKRQTPGMRTREEHATLFERVEAFFEERILPQGGPQQDNFHRNFLVNNMDEPSTYDVDGIGLVLFLDEPTAFLDYRAKHYFRKRLDELVSRYKNLQVFITTNDAVMVENHDGVFLDYYGDQVTSTREFGLES
jgi:energy-coupling factor transporter ATP-binding protein EcfA2